MAKIKVDIGPLRSIHQDVHNGGVKLSRYMDVLQKGLVVRAVYNPEAIGKVIAFSKRGYGTVDVEWVHPQTMLTTIDKQCPLYEWEIVVED